MEFLKIFILFGLIGTAFVGGSPTCEPFVTKFQAFQKAWLTALDHIQAYSKDSSVAQPLLTPAFVKDLVCETNGAVAFAGKAISRLSGVSSEKIYSILNNPVDPPFEAPLDCIANDLVAMRNRVSTIMNTAVPTLKAVKVIAPSIGNNCFEIYGYLSSYVMPSFTLITSKGGYVYSDTQAFAALNMADIYQQSLAEAIVCTPQIVSAGMGAVFNTDATPFIDYYYGKSTVLPYPFSCIQGLIDIGIPMLNQTRNSFITGQQLNLALPPIPNFFG